MAKAVFVGINYYDKVYRCQNLEGLPCVYAKSMLIALTDLTSNFEKSQCLFFTDRPNFEIEGVKVNTPTKDNVTKALKDMVSSAQDGDTLLFYFCGHGANEYQTNRGALKTLNSELDQPQVTYSDELEDIFKHLPKNVSMNFLIHACFSGAMFSYNPSGVKGVALCSVGPDIPSVVRKEPDTEDFTTVIRDKVIKKLPADGPKDSKWPTYQSVFEEVKKVVVKGKKRDGVEFEGHAEIYHSPEVNPVVAKFLKFV